MKFWEGGDPPPCFNIDGVNYIFVRKNGLLFAVSTQWNVSPSMFLELLNRLAKVFKDYCGILSEVGELCIPRRRPAPGRGDSFRFYPPDGSAAPSKERLGYRPDSSLADSEPSVFPLRREVPSGAPARALRREPFHGQKAGSFLRGEAG